jgi:hypothetical protein
MRLEIQGLSTTENGSCLAFSNGALILFEFGDGLCPNYVHDTRNHHDYVVKNNLTQEQIALQ